MTGLELHLLTPDESLFARLQASGLFPVIFRVHRFKELALLAHGAALLIDLPNPGLPATNAPEWQPLLAQLKIGFISSAPSDAEGIQLLEAGACAYGHSYASETTLRQMLEVMYSGEIWVGRSLMSRLLKHVNRAAKPLSEAWKAPLTEREREVAYMAAMGESNLAIASSLGITERTVKTHLTAIFEKLSVADRLQLALKIHGIR